MKIVADRNIPEVAAAFADLGEVELLPGREIRPDHLRDCRCLVVRSVTRVDAALLAGSAVEFVATATIGTDHVDLEYLASAGIGFANAAGCNAEAAAEYVIAGLFALSAMRGFDPLARRAGIVGCGNVGGRLAARLDALGIETWRCDPPLAAQDEHGSAFVDLDTLLAECDLISLHVPLTRHGDHPTFHLLDAARLRCLREGSVLINAARGEVLRRREDLVVFLDTWEGEPLISRELLSRVDLATPHIAGYSVEGRLRGTQMALDAACQHFGVDAAWRMEGCLPRPRELAPDPAQTGAGFWRTLFRLHWDIVGDHADLRRGAELDDAGFARHFDGLRRIYPGRVEYPRCIVVGRKSRPEENTLLRLGFDLR